MLRYNCIVHLEEVELEILCIFDLAMGVSKNLGMLPMEYSKEIRVEENQIPSHSVSRKALQVN